MSKGPDKRITTRLRLLSKLHTTSIRHICLFAVAVLFLLIPTGAVSATQSKTPTALHHFQLACQTCHSPGESGSDYSDSTNVSGNIEQLCTPGPCHDYNPVMNHPVGVTIYKSVSGDMPLDSAGRITCLTCHYKPSSSGASTDIDESQDRTLYKPQGLQFCASCHAKMNTTFQQDSHWQFSASAHLGLINPSQLSTPARQRIGGIDTESYMCLSCHDEVTVTIPLERETRQQKVSRWRNMRDHPIGMDYSRVALLKSRQYRYPLLNDRIRLFDGRMGCGSCHSIYSDEKKFLVQSNYRSALCRQCHDL
jgi:predicted CXXCH cytochrome family protein